MNWFVAANYIVYVLYVVAYLGVWREAPEYLEYLRTILKLYVAIVLILTFNPFVSLSSSVMNRQIAFSAGIFILTGLSLDKVQQALDVNNLLRPIFPSLVF
jgi:hypothetical protein